MGMSAAAATAVLPAISSAESGRDECDLHAEKLAEAMKAKHGGDWAVNIKPEYGFVVIVKA